MNPFKVLGIPSSSTISEIKIAYRRAAAQNHPDRGGSHQAMVAVNAAYEELTQSHSGRGRKTTTTRTRRSKTKTTTKTSQPASQHESSPINSPYWLSIYHELVSVSKEKEYKRGWVAYELSKLRPPIGIWRLHAHNMGYKEG
jgi:preprotein translocase subunit Sec63